jgi:uncharacterized protein (TIGR02444 family)
MTEQHTHPSTNTPLWRFSLHFYRQAGVADACIALQDGCGVDVNLLLFVLWLSARRRHLSVGEVRDLDAAVRTWRDLTIVPVRAIRRNLKGAATVVDANKQEALRTRIKAVELEAERLQQEALYARSRSLPFGRDAAPAAAARANLAAYQQILTAEFPKPAVNRLLGAFDAINLDEFTAP